MLAAIYKKGPEIQIKVEACLVWFHAKKKKTNLGMPVPKIIPQY